MSYIYIYIYVYIGILQFSTTYAISMVRFLKTITNIQAMSKWMQAHIKSFTEFWTERFQSPELCVPKQSVNTVT